MLNRIEELADQNFKLDWHKDQAAFHKLMHNVREIEILEHELDQARRKKRIQLVTW